MMVGASRRILIVRVGRAGDLVMITPALRMVLDAFPDAEVHLLTTAEGPRVLGGFDPRLTRFHLYHRRLPGSLFLPHRTARTLAIEGFERVFLFESNPHYRKLVTGIAPRIHELTNGGSESHYAARCLALVESTLAAPPARTWIRLPVSALAREAAEQYLAAAGLAPDQVLVGLHLTYSETSRASFRDRRGRRHRQWPLAAWAELAHLLHDQGRARGIPLRPIVDVLPNERPIVEEFARRAGEAATLLSGSPDFERYKALLERLRLFVTPNTGPMHIAAAVGTPVVALFSGWSPEDSGPFAPSGRVRVLQVPTGRSAAGLAALSPALVLEACLKLLPEV
jgi:ADP-heptose:LPS heptosyltransferase